MARRIQLRRDTAASWGVVNPILASGEPGLETDTGIPRIGDGSTAFTSLPPLMTAKLYDAKGDILVGSADNAVVRKPVGADGTVLTADAASAGGIKWSAAAGGGMLATKTQTTGGGYSVTATTATIVSAGNLTTPNFVVPASGQYVVRFHDVVLMPANATYLVWVAMVAGTQVGQSQQAAFGINAQTTQMTISTDILVTGRTPGNTEAIQWAAYVGGAASAVTMYTGNGNLILMEVMAA